MDNTDGPIIDRSLTPDATNDFLITENGIARFLDLPGLTASEKQQRTIVAAFVPKLHEILADQPITLHNLSKKPDYPSYRRAFLDALRTGRISTSDENAYLLSLPSAVDTLGSRAVYDQISANLRTKQILAIVTGHNSVNWQDTITADLEKFIDAPTRIEKDYRTPVGFADLRRRFLAEIRELAKNPADLDRYIRAMDNFEKILYGTRFEYYLDFESLRKESESLADNVFSFADATAPTTSGVADSSTSSADAPLDLVMQSSHLSPVTDEHRDQLVAHAVLEGDAWRQGGQDYRLSVASLVQAGLVPKYEITIDNQTFYLTNLFTLTSGCLAALAFVPTESGAVKVRSFYRDLSSALWHYLPDYIRGNNGEGLATFGKGFHERSTILPILLQAALNQIERNRGLLDLSHTNPDFLFAGVAPAYASMQEFMNALTSGSARGDFYRTVSSTAMNGESLSTIDPTHRKSAPQLISMSVEQTPNFNLPIAHYSVYSNLTGQTMGRGFPSEDKQTYYLFYTDYRGRSWISYVETNSLVTSCGCRVEWLLPTDVATPLYETTILAASYGDPGDVRGGNLISMWNNYLSKIPLIQQYSATLSIWQNPA